jgi:hypothetical protein
MKIRSVVWIGLAFGLAGAIGQLLLSRVGVRALDVTDQINNLLVIAPLRGFLTLGVPTAIGVLIGIRSPQNASSAAAVAGVIAAVPATLAQFGSILMNTSLTGQSPLSSVEAFLMFVGTLIACTVLWSWVLGGLAALVARTCSQSS